MAKLLRDAGKKSDLWLWTFERRASETKAATLVHQTVGAQPLGSGKGGGQNVPRQPILP